MEEIVTVLYAEDDLLTRIQVKEEMEKKGWQVSVAGDGEEAFAFYKAQRPDVIILDVDMPRCSGLEVLQLIRTSDMYIPIIMYSALKTDENVRKGFSGGANVYMIKDYSISSLIMQVEKCISKNGDIIVLNDSVYYNTKTFTLYTPQGFRKLSMLENRIFSVLCRNKNSLVQRSLLIKVGWELSNVSSQLQLNKMIYRLRDLFAFVDGFEIVTEKGHGYWLRIKD